jgi:hypothetical protein
MATAPPGAASSSLMPDPPASRDDHGLPTLGRFRLVVDGVLGHGVARSNDQDRQSEECQHDHHGHDVTHDSALAFAPWLAEVALHRHVPSIAMACALVSRRQLTTAGGR